MSSKSKKKRHSNRRRAVNKQNRTANGDVKIYLSQAEIAVLRPMARTILSRASQKLAQTVQKLEVMGEGATPEEKQEVERMRQSAVPTINTARCAARILKKLEPFLGPIRELTPEEARGEAPGVKPKEVQEHEAQLAQDAKLAAFVEAHANGNGANAHLPITDPALLAKLALPVAVTSAPVCAEPPPGVPRRLGELPECVGDSDGDDLAGTHP